jgi:hypothetical protein
MPYSRGFSCGTLQHIRVFTYARDGLFNVDVILRNSALRFSLIKLTSNFFKLAGNKLLRGECHVGHLSDRLSHLHRCAVRFCAPCGSADRAVQALNLRAFLARPCRGDLRLAIYRSLVCCQFEIRNRLLSFGLLSISRFRQ